MLAHRTHVAVGLLCSLGWLAMSPVRAAADDDKAKTVDAEQPDLSKLPNDDLLKQANAIYARGSGDCLAAVRALAGVKAQLDDASKQLAVLTPPKGEPKKDGDPKVKDTVNEATAKAAVDAAKSKADFAGRPRRSRRFRFRGDPCRDRRGCRARRPGRDVGARTMGRPKIPIEPYRRGGHYARLAPANLTAARPPIPGR